MAIKLGSGNISKLYLGSTEITKAYLGSTEVYNTGTPATNDAFELTVETTAANESFLLPMQSVTSIDVDWGDGTVDTGITTDNPTHTYATAGTHAISVTGTAGTLKFGFSGSQSKLRTVTNLGALGWTNLGSSFRDCTNMTSFDAGDCDTSNVTRMDFMFSNCSSLPSLDLSSFNTSNVTNMRVMFTQCSSLTSLDVSNFNTSNVTSIESMFRSCSSLTSLDVSNFDTSNVTSMEVMFLSCSSLTDIIGVENFDISQVTKFNASWGGQFMSGFALPTSRYDALLVNWEAQAVQPNLSVTFGSSQYTAGGAAEAARTTLVSIYGWTITDGGAA